MISDCEETHSRPLGNLVNTLPVAFRSSRVHRVFVSCRHFMLLGELQGLGLCLAESYILEKPRVAYQRLALYPTGPHGLDNGVHFL